MKKLSLTSVFTLIILSFVLVCGQAFAGEVRILADESFEASMPGLIKAYTKLYPKDKVSYKITDPVTLFFEIKNNKSKNYDLVMSYDGLVMSSLSDNHLFEIASRATIGVVDLYLVTSDKNKSLKSFGDLTTSKVKKIAFVKNSLAARYSVMIFEKLKTWDRLSAKAVIYNTRKEADEALKAGKADCSIYIEPFIVKGLRKVSKTPKDSHMPVLVTDGIVRGTKNYNTASNFSYFLNTKPSKDVLTKNGFQPGTVQY